VLSGTLSETIAVGVFVTRFNPGDGPFEPVRPQVELANRQCRADECFDTKDNAEAASDWDYIRPLYADLAEISQRRTWLR